MRSKIMALGDGQNDTPMIQNADIGVRIDNSLFQREEKQADIVIYKFDDLITLMYHHGYNCYSQTSRIIYFYMYKNLIIVFVQIWYQFHCMSSGSNVLPSQMVGLYNSVLTTLQVFAAFYYEQSFDSSEYLVSSEQYRRNLKSSIFSYKSFWGWLFTAFTEGTLLYWLVITSYSEAVDFTGHTVDHEIIGSLMFSVVLNVINLKLQLVLHHKSAVAGFISLMSTLFYYGIMFCINDERLPLSNNFDASGAVPEQMTTVRGFII